MFISFEGIDSSGKTTHIELLANVLRQRGEKVLLTREPGGTALAEKLRQLLLETTATPPAELLLFGAARAQHVAEVIRPALSQATTVICDRFVDSSVAYQGAGLGLSIETINTINRFACDEIMPQKTFLLDIEPQNALRRQQSDGQPLDVIELRGLEFQQRVRHGYLEIARKHPKRVVIIDADREVSAVHEDILRAL